MSLRDPKIISESKLDTSTHTYALCPLRKHDQHTAIHLPQKPESQPQFPLQPLPTSQAAYIYYSSL